MGNKNSPNNSNNILFNEFFCAWIPNKMEKRTPISAWSSSLSLSKCVYPSLCVGLLVSQIVRNIILCIIRKEYSFSVQPKRKRANKKWTRVRKFEMLLLHIYGSVFEMSIVGENPTKFFAIFFLSLEFTELKLNWTKLSSLGAYIFIPKKEFQPKRSHFVSRWGAERERECKKSRADGNDDPKNVTYSPHSIFSFDS